MDTKELLKKVRKIEIKTRRLSDHIFGGEYHSTFKGRGMTFSEVRQYQYGDDVRNIDWNVTARTNEPHIKVFEEEVILDTGGALVNAKHFLSDDYFLVLNSDTVWQKNYILGMKTLIKNTIQKNFLAGLLLARKDKSFDPNLNEDFCIENDCLTNKKNYIYTGFQILNSSLLENKEVKPFSIKKIWNHLIEQKKITGEVFEQTFYHTTDLEIYNKLKSKNIIF